MIDGAATPVEYHKILAGKGKYYILVIMVLTGLITYLHLAVFREPFTYVVLEEFYYIPLLIGALKFGLKGALVTYLFVSAAYLPFFFAPWTETIGAFADRALHLLSSGLFSALAGVLVDREERYRRQSEKDRHLAKIGQVAAIIVHDLKSPLISILGFGKRLQEGKGDILSAAEAITESAQNMQKIVNSVLDLSKPLQLEMTQKDLREAVRQASESCHAKADEKGIKLSVEVPDAPVISIMDHGNIRRALVNLIDNAVDASARGQDVMISLGTKKRGIAVLIKDNGEGMDPETADNIFIPFFTRKAGGTGLGMAIAKKIIEEHQGHIRVESRRGKGTTITITLPREAAVEETG